jgi:hypothetical protein
VSRYFSHLTLAKWVLTTEGVEKSCLKVFGFCFDLYKYALADGFGVWPDQCIIWRDSTGTNHNNNTSSELNQYFVPFKPQWNGRLMAWSVDPRRGRKGPYLKVPCLPTYTQNPRYPRCSQAPSPPQDPEVLCVSILCSFRPCVQIALTFLLSFASYSLANFTLLSKFNSRITPFVHFFNKS